MVNVAVESRASHVVCSKSRDERSVSYIKPPNGRIPFKSRGRGDKTSQSVYTQTPTNELSYEFDKAFYTFKENVRRTVPFTPNQRPNLRVYLPTIIDTTPRTRKSRSKVDPVLSRMLACTHRTTQPTRTPCTCNHRAGAREEPRAIARAEPPDTARAPEVPFRTDITSPSVPIKRVEVKKEDTAEKSRKKREKSNHSNHITPVLAVAIRRNPQDKDPIVEFNGVLGPNTRFQFNPFVRHISTQTSKSNVHVEFDITDES